MVPQPMLHGLYRAFGNVIQQQRTPHPLNRSTAVFLSYYDTAAATPPAIAIDSDVLHLPLYAAALASAEAILSPGGHSSKQ